MKPHRSIETTSASPARERDDSLVAFRASAAPSWPHTEEGGDSRPPLAELSVLVRKTDSAVRWVAVPGDPPDLEDEAAPDLRPYLNTTGWVRAASHVKRPVVLWAAVAALAIWVVVMSFSSLRREAPRPPAALVGNSVAAAPVVLRLAPEGAKAAPSPEPSVSAEAPTARPSNVGASDVPSVASAPASNLVQAPPVTVAAPPVPPAAPARMAKPAFDRW